MISGIFNSVKSLYLIICSNLSFATNSLCFDTYIKFSSNKDKINSLINWGIPLNVLFNKNWIISDDTEFILVLRNSYNIDET